MQKPEGYAQGTNELSTGYSQLVDKLCENMCTGGEKVWTMKNRVEKEEEKHCREYESRKRKKKNAAGKRKPVEGGEIRRSKNRRTERKKIGRK